MSNNTERFEKEIPSDDSASVGEKQLLYWLIRETQPLCVVETGTHRGLSGLYMAQALEDNGKGHLHTADPNEQWGQRGNFRKYPELEKRITFYPSKGMDMIQGFREGEIDFAFIDGFHGKEDVLPEIKELLPRLSDEAVVVFHDCWPTNRDEVNEACKEAGLHTVWIPTKNAIRIYCKKIF